MKKANAALAMDRWQAMYNRQMQDQILVSFIPGSDGLDEYNRRWDSSGSEWTERPCRCEVDMEGVIAEGKSLSECTAQLPDDSLPKIYPTLSIGEGIASALLGGSIRFIGNEFHTVSRTEPIIHSRADLDKLRIDNNTEWAQRYRTYLQRAVELDNNDVFFAGFVVMDALNLCMELRGHEQAYSDVYEDPGLLREIMAFGVEFGIWFNALEKEFIAPHNEAVAQGHPYAHTGHYIGFPWTSIDGYINCNPRIYAELGQQYHAEFFRRVGGGLVHTHGQNVMKFLPMLAEIPNLSWIQVGSDLNDGTLLPIFDLLPEIRRMTKDIPLVDIYISHEEFVNGLRDHTLVGGIHYVIQWPNTDIDEMKHYMDKVYAYQWQG